eukprot:1147858-Pelagomonas_calceolata.AAC.11
MSAPARYRCADVDHALRCLHCGGVVICRHKVHVQEVCSHDSKEGPKLLKKVQAGEPNPCSAACYSGNFSFMHAAGPGKCSFSLLLQQLLQTSGVCNKF